jgi:DNA-binding transcriptional ArsR family regulator
MTRLAVGAADLLTVRFAWSPVWETMAAVRTFVDPRSRHFHEPWHAAIADEVAHVDLTPLLAVNPYRGFVPDFLTPPPLVPAPRLGDELALVRATRPAQVRHELERCRRSVTDADAGRALDALVADPRSAREVLADRLHHAWQRLVQPFWPRVRALLDNDLAYRSRLLTRHGLQRLLDGIDPRISWGGEAIVVDDGLEAAVALDGRGLVLMPSAYVWPAVVAIVDEPWQPTIAYPARGVGELWHEPKPPSRALARLLGRTRALMLASLDEPMSTTTLAATLGLSASGASGHLIVLRDAGLVAATRHGHEMRYRRTRLGSALVHD